MYSCVASALSVIDCVTNAPTSVAEIHTAVPAATATASVAPRCPKRSAAQINAGNTMYVSGSSADSAIALSATTATITSTPSQALRPHHISECGCTQARASGMITSEPDASARNQLRQNLANSEASTVPPAREESVATVAVIAPPAAIATSIAPTSSSRSSAARDPSSRRSNNAITRMSAMLPAVIASALGSDCAGSARARSPMSTPGHQRRPAR